MADKLQALSSMTTRQKVTAGVVVLVVLIIIWQVVTMFSGGDETPPIEATTANKSAQGPVVPPPPKPTELAQTQPMTEREAALVKLQQETQNKYLEALNELQMLKVKRDI